MKIKLLVAPLLSLMVFLTGCMDDDVPPPAAMVEYTVTFDATWSAATHPTDFPANPHFSPLVGLTHNASFSLWADGGTATAGMETVAETGGTATLLTEIAAAIADGSGHAQLLDSGNIGLSPGSTSLTFTAHIDHPLVSLVSMIAPSPDWFVGVHDLSLLSNGQWQQSITVDLVPWDAGTDSGSTYTSADADVTPHQPITEITGAPLASGGMVAPLGTYTFTRL